MTGTIIHIGEAIFLNLDIEPDTMVRHSGIHDDTIEVPGDLIVRLSAVLERLEGRGIAMAPPSRRIVAENNSKTRGKPHPEPSAEGGLGTTCPETTTNEHVEKITLADCLPVLRQRVKHSPATAKHYDGLLRCWGAHHDSLGVESPDIRDIGDGDFATFCESVPAWKSLRSREKNWAYFSKLLRCRTPRAAGFSWGDPPDSAILSRLPLSGLENQTEPVVLKKSSGVLSTEQIEALMVAAAASDWPETPTLAPAVTWFALYGLAMLCGIAPDDLLDFEHSGDRSEYDAETKTLNFIRGKTGVSVNLPLPTWLSPLFDVLKADAIATGRRLMFPFDSPTVPCQRIGTAKIVKRIKRHYEAASVEPLVEKRRRLWLYGFRKTSVTWWLSHYPGWQALVNGHSVEGSVAEKHYAQVSELRPILEAFPAPGKLKEFCGQITAGARA